MLGLCLGSGSALRPRSQRALRFSLSGHRGEEVVARAFAATAGLSADAAVLYAVLACPSHSSPHNLQACAQACRVAFATLVALLRPGGSVVNASSYGARTPFFTPPGLLERGIERRGLRTIAAEQVGLGTYYLAKRS